MRAHSVVLALEDGAPVKYVRHPSFLCAHEMFLSRGPRRLPLSSSSHSHAPLKTLLSGPENLDLSAPRALFSFLPVTLGLYWSACNVSWPLPTDSPCYTKTCARDMHSRTISVSGSLPVGPARPRSRSPVHDCRAHGPRWTTIDCFSTWPSVSRVPAADGCSGVVAVA